MSNPVMLADEICERRRRGLARVPGGPPGKGAIVGEGA